jgi:hypothetical protein
VLSLLITTRSDRKGCHTYVFLCIGRVDDKTARDERKDGKYSFETGTGWDFDLPVNV